MSWVLHLACHCSYPDTSNGSVIFPFLPLLPFFPIFISSIFVSFSPRTLGTRVRKGVSLWLLLYPHTLVFHSHDVRGALLGHVMNVVQCLYYARCIVFIGVFMAVSRVTKAFSPDKSPLVPTKARCQRSGANIQDLFMTTPHVEWLGKSLGRFFEISIGLINNECRYVTCTADIIIRSFESNDPIVLRKLQPTLTTCGLGTSVSLQYLSDFIWVVN